MRALEAADHQGRADRPEARHGDGDRQGQAVRAHDPAARRRDRRPPRRRGLHRRLARRRRAAATSPSTRSTPIADGTIYDYFDGRADLAAGRVRFIGDPDSASPRIACASCASSASTPGTAGRRSTGRASTPAGATPAALGGLSGERVAKELLRLLDGAGAGRRAARRWPRPARSITGCRNMPARERLRAPGRRARTSPIRCAAWRRSCRRRRRDGDRQAAETLDPGIAAPAVMLARARDRHRRRTESLRAALYRLGTSLFIDRLLLRRCAGRLARRARAGAQLDAARTAGRAAPMRWRSA